MTDDSKPTHKLLLDASAAVASAGAGTAGALLTGASAVAAAGTGALALLPFALVATIGVALEWKKRDAARWWNEFLHGPAGADVTPEEFAGRVEAHQEEPFVRETVLRSVRALQDALDPCVVTPLALLARQYVEKGEVPDSFFRGTCGVLMDLGAAEYEQLRRCFEAGGKLKLRYEEDKIRISNFDPHTRNQSKPPTEFQFNTMDGAVGIRDIPQARRLIRLLIRNDLAIDVATGTAVDRGQLATATVRRLSSILK